MSSTGGDGDTLTPIPSKPSGQLHKKASVEEGPVVEEADIIDPSRIFALIIGINRYKLRTYNLRGAVPDGVRMKAYLKSLGVPSSRIKTLFDKKATRKAIIANLTKIKTHSKIRDGDPILIFYAGHGGIAKTPDDWDAGSDHIQVLLPHDFYYASHDNPVHAIPDRTILSLLEQIAAAKGDNITVVFDCCFSGSMPRGGLESQLRRVDLKISVPRHLDIEIWGMTSDPVKNDAGQPFNADTNRGSFTPKRYLKRGLRSYVLLSACGEDQYARETPIGGIFTTHLLDALEAVDASTVTYVDLVNRIPCQTMKGTICSSECIMTSTRQSPQCEGDNRSRICFNFKSQGPLHRMYVVRKVNQEYIMEAGAACAITEGAIFALYTERNPAPTQAPVATLRASSIKGAITTLVPLPESARPDIKKQAFALLIEAGEDESFCVHIEPNEKLEAILDKVVEEREIFHPMEPKILFVEREKAELEIAIDDETNKLVFDIMDPLVREQGLCRLYGTTPLMPKDVGSVVRRAAHYFWHLRRTGNPKHLQGVVDIELRRLEEVDEEYDDMFNPVRRPYGPDLIQGGVIDIVVEKEALYGIKLVNKSKRSLYPYLFYFDNSDLSITKYFQPGISAGEVDAPLRPNGSIPIGYGNTGTPPLVYVLREGQDVDVGFLKLFLSVDYVDLSDIPQESPFEGHLKAPGTYKGKKVGLWSTTMIPFIQRRSPLTSLPRHIGEVQVIE